MPFCTYFNILPFCLPSSLGYSSQYFRPHIWSVQPLLSFFHIIKCCRQYRFLLHYRFPKIFAFHIFTCTQCVPVTTRRPEPSDDKKETPDCFDRKEKKIKIRKSIPMCVSLCSILSDRPGYGLNVFVLSKAFAGRIISSEWRAVVTMSTWMDIWCFLSYVTSLNKEIKKLLQLVFGRVAN